MSDPTSRLGDWIVDSRSRSLLCHRIAEWDERSPGRPPLLYYTACNRTRYRLVSQITEVDGQRKCKLCLGAKRGGS
jgi:hypothetical protein